VTERGGGVANSSGRKGKPPSEKSSQKENVNRQRKRGAQGRERVH